jgi:hypothetical protein
MSTETRRGSQPVNPILRALDEAEAIVQFDKARDGQASGPVKVGDFFVTSWGYDQTNVEFYKVLGFTPSGKSVRVQEWSTKIERASGVGQDYLVPGDKPRSYPVWEHYDSEFGSGRRRKGEADAPIETKRLNTRYDPARPSISFESYRSAWLWDGAAEYATSSGWGR